MIKNTHTAIRELLGFDHGTVKVSSGVHPVREQFPELFGSKGINNTIKQNWQITDLLPLGVIFIFFVLLIWFFGVYSPAKKIAETNKNIEVLSRAFDERSNQVLSELNRLKASFTEDELPESTLNWLSGLELKVSDLTLNKPSESVIAKRFDAEKKFTDLSAQIIGNRDLSKYGELGDIPDDLEPHELRDRGQQAISLAEKWLDELTPQELQAKSLLSEFLGTPMPKREGQLKSLILEEWKAKHTSLLELWKSLKEYEVQWAQFLEEQRARETAKQERQAELDKRRLEIEEQMAENQKAIDEERARLRATQKNRLNQSANNRTNRTSVQPKKSQRELELEKRKKAASKLID